jgi:hypothetical protein
VLRFAGTILKMTRNTIKLCKLPKLGRLALGLFALLTPLFAYSPAGAEDTGVYTVSGVAVDVSADSALAAREKAMADGQRAALGQLVDRLAVGGNGGLADKARKMTDSQLAGLVQTLEVDQERVSAKRYRASLTVRFKPLAIRTLFDGSGVAFSDQAAPVRVVLAIQEIGGRPVLWEEPTLWRRAFEDLAPTLGQGLVPIRVPAGELDDIQAVSPIDAVNGTMARLAPLMDKYQASEVVVAFLRGIPGQGASLRLNRYGRGGLIEGAMLDPAALGVTTDGADAYKKLALAMMQQMEKATKSAATPAGAVSVANGAGGGGVDMTKAAVTSPLTYLRVIVPFTRLQDWMTVRARTSSAEPVRRVQVLAMNRTGAEIELGYQGDISGLIGALDQQGVLLYQNLALGGMWQMSGKP